MNATPSSSTIQVLKNILATALDIQKTCSPLLKNVSSETKDPPPSFPLQLSDPVPIIADLEKIGLATSVATSISNAFIRSCRTYRTVIEKSYDDARSTGKLSSTVCARFSDIFKEMYLSKVQAWKDETIAATLKRSQEVNDTGRSSIGCFNYVGTI